jgi:Holliday junction resolvasome RuvABC endonuclease subunit
MSTKEFGTKVLPEKPVAIGIDQSLTGFAVSAVVIDSPEIHKTWVYKSPYRGVHRLKDIYDWLIRTFTEIESAQNLIVDVAMEGTVLASHSALALGELSATVKLACLEYFAHTTGECPLQIPPMTLKKYAAGKGNAKKQEMLLQIYKRWGVEFNDDNAADSYGLARMAAGISIDAVEASIIEQIKDPKYRDSIL